MRGCDSRIWRFQEVKVPYHNGMARISLNELASRAEQILPRPVFDFVAAGAGTEKSLSTNVEGWRNWLIAPAVLRSKGDASTATDLLGNRLDLPVILAPSGRQRALHPEGEMAGARAAVEMGSVYCLSTSATTDMHDLAPMASNVWQQLYVSTDRDWTRMMLGEAAQLGFGQVIITVDRPREAYRPRSAQHGGMGPLPTGVHVTSHRGNGTYRSSEPGVWEPELSWTDIEKFVSQSRIPVGVKGILRGDDAKRAVDAGVSSIVVSNHGGRQIDSVVSTADALIEVNEAVDGAVPVLVDGGIRSGEDVFKAIALGANAVLIGRPYLWALAIDGQSGIQEVLNTLRSELSETMSLAGANTIEDISLNFVRRR